MSEQSYGSINKSNLMKRAGEILSSSRIKKPRNISKIDQEFVNGLREEYNKINQSTASLHSKLIKSNQSKSTLSANQEFQRLEREIQTLSERTKELENKEKKLVKMSQKKILKLKQEIEENMNILKESENEMKFLQQNVVDKKLSTLSTAQEKLDFKISHLQKEKSKLEKKFIEFVNFEKKHNIKEHRNPGDLKVEKLKIKFKTLKSEESKTINFLITTQKKIDDIQAEQQPFLQKLKSFDFTSPNKQSNLISSSKNLKNETVLFQLLRKTQLLCIGQIEEKMKIEELRNTNPTHLEIFELEEEYQKLQKKYEIQTKNISKKLKILENLQRKKMSRKKISTLLKFINIREVEITQMKNILKDLYSHHESIKKQNSLRNELIDQKISYISNFLQKKETSELIDNYYKHLHILSRCFLNYEKNLTILREFSIRVKNSKFMSKEVMYILQKLKSMKSSNLSPSLIEHSPPISSSEFSEKMSNFLTLRIEQYKQENEKDILFIQKLRNSEKDILKYGNALVHYFLSKNFHPFMMESYEETPSKLSSPSKNSKKKQNNIGMGSFGMGKFGMDQQQELSSYRTHKAFDELSALVMDRISAPLTLFEKDLKQLENVINNFLDSKNHLFQNCELVKRIYDQYIIRSELFTIYISSLKNLQSNQVSKQYEKLRRKRQNYIQDLQRKLNFEISRVTELKQSVTLKKLKYSKSKKSLEREESLEDLENFQFQEEELESDFLLIKESEEELNEKLKQLSSEKLELEKERKKLEHQRTQSNQLFGELRKQILSDPVEYGKIQEEGKFMFSEIFEKLNAYKSSIAKVSNQIQTVVLATSSSSSSSTQRKTSTSSSFYEESEETGEEEEEEDEITEEQEKLKSMKSSNLLILRNSKFIKLLNALIQCYSKILQFEISVQKCQFDLDRAKEKYNQSRVDQQKLISQINKFSIQHEQASVKLETSQNEKKKLLNSMKFIDSKVSNLEKNFTKLRNPNLRVINSSKKKLRTLRDFISDSKNQILRKKGEMKKIIDRAKKMLDKNHNERNKNHNFMEFKIKRLEKLEKLYDIESSLPHEILYNSNKNNSKTNLRKHELKKTPKLQVGRYRRGGKKKKMGVDVLHDYSDLDEILTCSPQKKKEPVIGILTKKKFNRFGGKKNQGKFSNKKVKRVSFNLSRNQIKSPKKSVRGPKRGLSNSGSFKFVNSVVENPFDNEFDVTVKKIK